MFSPSMVPISVSVETVHDKNTKESFPRSAGKYEELVFEVYLGQGQIKKFYIL